MSDLTLFPQNQVDEMQREIEMLHAENALKFTQILDLEQLIWDMRTPRWNDDDGSPCWCGEWNHTSECIKARQATEPFWKK
jgi:hypothetical protein